MYSNVYKCEPLIYKCKRGGAGAGRCDARAANVPCARAAWSNADEGGERKAARVQGSFAALAGCAPPPPRLLLLYNKLPSQLFPDAYMYYLFMSVIYHLVYFDKPLFCHFIYQVV